MGKLPIALEEKGDFSGLFCNLCGLKTLFLEQFPLRVFGANLF